MVKQAHNNLIVNNRGEIEGFLGWIAIGRVAESNKAATTHARGEKKILSALSLSNTGYP